MGGWSILTESVSGIRFGRHLEDAWRKDGLCGWWTIIASFAFQKRLYPENETYFY
jgi:hypothetical protein